MSEQQRRQLLVVAYDIVQPVRLPRALHAVTGWAHGGQKSVYECFATVQERGALIAAMRKAIDPREDKLAILLPRQDGFLTLGQGKVSAFSSLVIIE